ncbi:MAG: hypothetical protein MJZ37_08595 [Bacilli bacterium]|nr:hypothetical protein [Bacilli bacterium]
MELYEGQLKTYEWDITTKRNHHKGKAKKSKRWCNNIICFDTESTSAFVTESGDVISYEAGQPDEYWNSLTPVSVTYIWMCGVDDNIYYGREIEAFIELLDDLPSDAEVIIWVHNLAYDFNSALINILHFTDVFARSPHKPMYAVSEEYPNIKFKCSYTLTNLSLENWGKMLGVHKKKGDLDYNVMRTPLSQLDVIEMGYCEADIAVMIAGIRKYVERFGSLKDIPLTKTGIVRNKTKEILCIPYYIKCIKRLVPSTAELYHILLDLFAAGYTHANRYYSCQTITTLEFDFIGHRDFASSYPTWCICGKLPCTPWVLIGNDLPDPKTFDNIGYIIKLELWDIECITFNTYIQGSKCTELRKAKWDNGRIITAEHLCITCTELDYDLICRTYKIGKKASRATYRSEKDYAPDDFRSYILDLYEAKTKWKNVEGYEDIYMNAKGDINSASFGMMVTAIMQAEVIYDNNEWYTVPLTKEAVQDKLDDLRKYNPRDKRYFLNYSWGIWIAALARHALWECILYLDTPNKRNAVLYCDTDSIFYIGKQDFSWYDDYIDQKLKEACEEGGLDFEKTRPTDRHGKQYPLGHFVEESEHITEFRALGAKRYCCRWAEDNKLHLTVSGINKEAVECLNDDIESFKDGVVFDKDHPAVHKLLHTYTKEQPVVVFPDGYVLHQKYGVNMRPTGYDLEVKDEYKKLLKFMDLNINDLSEQQFVNLRSKFPLHEE